jgi:hypothetical protein
MTHAMFIARAHTSLIAVLLLMLTATLHDYRTHVLPTIDLLREVLEFRPTDARRVLRRAPQVLLTRVDGTTAIDTIEVLQAIGFKPKQLKVEVSRCVTSNTCSFILAVCTTIDTVGCHV